MHSETPDPTFRMMMLLTAEQIFLCLKPRWVYNIRKDLKRKRRLFEKFDGFKSSRLLKNAKLNLRFS